MTDTVSISGRVVADPENIIFENGGQKASFRLASTQRRQDPQSKEWSDAYTNFYQVGCYRGLAEHVLASIRKGEPVLVSGRLRVRTYTRQDGSFGTSIEIDAEHVGHDLRFGSSRFARSYRADADEQRTRAAEEPAPGSPEAVFGNAPSGPEVDPDFARVGGGFGEDLPPRGEREATVEEPGEETDEDLDDVDLATGELGAPAA